MDDRVRLADRRHDAVRASRPLGRFDLDVEATRGSSVALPVRRWRCRRWRGVPPDARRDRPPLLVGVGVVAQIEEHREDYPEPVQPRDPLRRRADEQPDQGREWKEDQPEQRKYPRVEYRIEVRRPRDPGEHHNEARRERR
jgi:hypothetical protein